MNGWGDLGCGKGRNLLIARPYSTIRLPQMSQIFVEKHIALISWCMLSVNLRHLREDVCPYAATCGCHPRSFFSNLHSFKFSVGLAVKKWPLMVSQSFSFFTSRSSWNDTLRDLSNGARQ